MTHGEKDEFGLRAEGSKMHGHDLHATILRQLGIDHERLTDVHGRIIPDIIA